jgi:hypothetical protein
MAAMSTPCTNCQYLALHSSVCENPTHFSFLLQNEKEEEIMDLKQNWEKT